MAEYESGREVCCEGTRDGEKRERRVLNIAQPISLDNRTIETIDAAGARCSRFVLSLRDFQRVPRILHYAMNFSISLALNSTTVSLRQKYFLSVKRNFILSNLI